MHKDRNGRIASAVSITSVKNEEVAASLYREHHKPLKSYVVRRVPGREISHAEDVVQETFVRTIRYLNNGNAVNSPKGFLYTTARNVITSMFYRGWKQVEVESLPSMDDHASSANVGSPENHAFIEQKLDAFSAAISAIPGRYQEAFVRRRIWGESCSEIAATMRLSERAVSNYAALGWKLLGEYCDKHGIELDDFIDQR